MAFYLTDDGTLDTVVRCEHCGHEERFNYDPSPDPFDIDPNADADTLYDTFIDACCERAAEDHECTEVE